MQLEPISVPLVCCFLMVNLNERPNGQACTNPKLATSVREINGLQSADGLKKSDDYRPAQRIEIVIRHAAHRVLECAGMSLLARVSWDEGLIADP